MALSPQAKARLSRPEIVRWYLNKMARKADPVNGHMTKLAESLELHPTTLSDWAAQGYVPHFQCKKLHKRFGKLAPLDDLCPAEYRAR